MIPYTYDFDYYVGDTYPIVIYDGNLEERDLFVALPFNGNLNSAISTDAVTWTQVAIPLTAPDVLGNPTNRWRDVTYGKLRFISCAWASSNRNVAISSISGESLIWTIGTLPVLSNWKTITYGKNVFVAIGRQGFDPAPVAVSTDGLSWTRKTMVPTISTGQWTVNYANDIFVAVSDSFLGTTATSTDGTTWTQGENLNTVDFPIGWKEPTYGNNIFVAINENFSIPINKVAYSTNGISWTQKTLPLSDIWQVIAYGNNRFVILSSEKVFSSTNGVLWTQGTLTQSSFWTSLVYANDFFYAVGGDRVFKSTDGITWQICSDMPTSGNSGWYAFTFSKDFYPKSERYLLNKTGMFTVSTERGNTEAEIFSIPIEMSYPEHSFFVEIDSANGSLLTGPSYVYDIEFRDDNEVYTLLTGTIRTQQDVKSN